MPSVRTGLAATIAVTLGILCTACSDPAPRTSTPMPSAGASESAAPSESPTVDVDSIGLEAQSVAIEVAQWAADHGATLPASQAEFQAKVKYADSLTAGSQAAYQKDSAEHFRICVVKFAANQAQGWSIFDSDANSYEGAAGKPTAKFCP